MNRPLSIASGVAVLFTTLAFSHIVFHNTHHMIAEHHAKLMFVALHSALALIVVALSLTGAYFLLTSRRKENSN